MAMIAGRSAISGLAMICMASFAAASPITQELAPPADATAKAMISTKLAFNSTGDQLITLQQDGTILAWDLKQGTAILAAQTEQAFAYCPAADRLVISAGQAAVLLSMRDGGYAALSEGLYDHAAFSADCSVMALAEGTTSTVELWQLSENPVLRTSATLAPVRNGIALTPDGRRLAAATSPGLDDSSAETAIEFFELNDDIGLQRISRLQIADTALGLQAMTFVARNLVTGTQRRGAAGLTSTDPLTGQATWAWAGFDASWITALAPADDEASFASADDAGTITIWSAETGENRGSFEAPTAVTALAWSHDGARIAAALATGMILILDVNAILDAGN